MAEVDTIDIPDVASATKTVATMSKAIKTFGLPTDAKSAATDATSVTMMQVLKEMSDRLQLLATSLGVTLVGGAIPINVAGGGNANLGNDIDAIAAAATSAAPVLNFNYGFNGTSWDRLRVDGGKNLKVAPSVSASANGLTSSRVKAAASTNATNLKASAGSIASIDVFNVAAYSVFLQLYNKASAPTVGTDVPVWTIPIAAGTGFSRSFPTGKSFATGISYAITKLQADTDTTVVVANDLTGSIDWI